MPDIRSPRLSSWGCTKGATTPANAQFFATICNDIQCTGGDDLIVQDNVAGDTALAWVRSASRPPCSDTPSGQYLAEQADGRQRRRAPARSELHRDEGAAPVGNPVPQHLGHRLFARQRLVAVALGGTNSGGSGSVTGRAWGGTSNTALLFSGANLFGTIAALTGPAFMGHRDRAVLGDRQSLLADHRRRDHARHRGNDHRRPEPAALAGSGAEHLGA